MGSNFLKLVRDPVTVHDFLSEYGLMIFDMVLRATWKIQTDEIPVTCNIFILQLHYHSTIVTTVQPSGRP